MKKLIFIAISTVLFGAGCAARPAALPVNSPAPTPEAQAPANSPAVNEPTVVEDSGFKLEVEHFNGMEHAPDITHVFKLGVEIFDISFGDWVSKELAVKPDPSDPTHKRSIYSVLFTAGKKEPAVFKVSSETRPEISLVSEKNSSVMDDVWVKVGDKTIIYDGITSTFVDGQEALKQLSLQWKKDGDLAQHVDQAVNNLENCSNIPSAIAPQNADLVPPNDVKLKTIATHGCDAALRVYLGCVDPIPESNNAPDQWVQVGKQWFACGTWKEHLILENIKTKQARFLGEIGMEGGANYGGMFVPFTFTKNDERVILDSWMFSPGAGGGSVDLGYDVSPIDSIAAKDGSGQASFSRFALFYDDYGKVIYIGNSDKMPSWSQPGPQSNYGTIMLLDLSTMKSSTVLEETDTTYGLDNIDQQKHTLNFESTKHVFTVACPRAEDAYICSEKTVQKRSLPLP